MGAKEPRVFFELTTPSEESEKTLAVNLGDAQKLLDALGLLLEKKKRELSLLEQMIFVIESLLGKKEAIGFLMSENIAKQSGFVAEAYCDSRKIGKPFSPSIVVFFDKAKCSDYGDMVIVQKEGSI